jgi:hypothetical protein
MLVNLAAMRQPLRGFDFRKLFVEELGWDHHTARLEVLADGQCFRLAGVAEKRGFQAFICEPSSTGCIPDYGTRRKIERQVTKSAHEHLIIFIDAPRTTQVWQWVKRELGKPAACREHTYDKSQPGDALIQKLQSLLVSFEEEEILTLVDVTGRARAGFDIERVTKRFYERFKTEHAAFMRFLKGIPDEGMQRWYISVMLNRLMFIYFIQKKSFLDSDTNYLTNRLRQTQGHGRDRFYSTFLRPLFFEGFAKRESERSPATNQLLGKVPYLNGGLFLRHQIEEACGKSIQIADAAFEKLFGFFGQYQWHLDERPLRADNEINPDVLGYIFEKYINQKQMGAYYTKEDITGYISQNTVIPFLFDDAQKKCKVAFEGDHAVWRLLQADPDRYIYPAVKKGADLPLPNEIAAGLNEVSKRTEWNKPAPEEYALPTEIWREVVARRKRYEEVKGKLIAGEMQSANDLITYNLDIRQFVQDVIENCEGPELLRALYHAIEQVTILDPACGSGAFLFATLNILEPLYEACLDRMEAFLEDLARSGEKHRPEKFSDFRKILERVAQHPNRRYFILKSVILNNLYGVDVMEEATEICKLRLFLKLVAQIDSVEKIEPLPDIDFNIRAGNTLVGYATYDDVKHAVSSKLDFEGKMAQIEEKAQEVEELFTQFRLQQTELGGEVTADDKAALRRRLKILEEELNQYLAGGYGIKAHDKSGYMGWVGSHKPFHWFIEFYGIMKGRGFDAVIGNPPYVEYRQVVATYRLPPNCYRSEDAANLYAYFMERSGQLLRPDGWFGMIVPTATLGLDETASLREVLKGRFPLSSCSSYAIRPSKLFEGVDQRLCIYVGRDSARSAPVIWSTRYHHWNAEERADLFPKLSYMASFFHGRLNRIPKIGCCEALNVLTKLEGYANKTIAYYFANGPSGYVMHYHRSPRYWIRAMDFEQYFKSPTRTRSIHHFRDLVFRDPMEGKIAGAILNSSLFFFWFISVGNGRNITGVDVEQFPVGDIGPEIRKVAPKIFDRLMKDYKANSFVRVRQDCEFQEFRPSLSKPIIDEIDRMLANHYGFSDEELDFIINYDIKYRMGREAAEEE